MFHSFPQTPHYPVQAPPTSHLSWSDKTPSHPNRGIKTLELTPLGDCQSIRPLKPLLPPTLLHRRWSVSSSINLTIFSFQANLQKDITHIKREWETVWEVFPVFSKNPIGKPATISPSSSSTSHTNIFSTTHHTLSSIATNHLHHTNHNLYHHSHTHYVPQTSTHEKDKKSCSHHIHSSYHNHFNQHFHHHIRNYHLPQEITFQKVKTICPDHYLKEKPTHAQSIHFNRYQAKSSKKNLSSHSHTTGLTSQHTPPPVPLPPPPPPQKTHQHQNINHSCTVHLLYSTVHLLSGPPIHNTPTTSTTPIQNTRTTITNTTTSTTTINTTTPTDTTDTPATARRTQIPSLMELNVSLPPRLHTPSTSSHHPHRPPSSSPISRRNSSNQESGDSTSRPTAVIQGSHHHSAVLKTTDQFNI